MTTLAAGETLLRHRPRVSLVIAFVGLVVVGSSLWTGTWRWALLSCSIATAVAVSVGLWMAARPFV